MSLSIRNGLVNSFYNNYKNLKNTETGDMNIFCISDKNYSIEYNIHTGQILFSTVIDIELQMPQKPIDPYNGLSYNICEPRRLQQKVGVMSYLDDEFMMIRADDSNWIEIMYDSIKSLSLYTNYGISYNKLPSTEEEFFQKITTNELVIELNECLKVKEMVDYIKNSVSVVIQKNNYRVRFVFNDELKN